MKTHKKWEDERSDGFQLRLKLNLISSFSFLLINPIVNYIILKVASYVK